MEYNISPLVLRVDFPSYFKLKEKELGYFGWEFSWWVLVSFFSSGAFSFTFILGCLATERISQCNRLHKWDHCVVVPKGNFSAVVDLN